MKLSNTVVSVIVIVAVLVSAYALGLLIRRARTGATRVQAPAEVNQVSRQTAVASHRPGEERTKDTPEERAKIKDRKAQALEKMNALTPEEKQEFREEIRKKVGGRQPDQTPKSRLSARQSKNTPEPGPAEAGGEKKKEEEASTPAPPGDAAATEPSADKAGAESGKAGPG